MPMLIYIIGMMGSGKTKIGKKLAKQLSYQFIDVDSYIEAKEQKTIAELFADKGEESFRILEHNHLLSISLSEDTVISTGGGLPCYYDHMQLMNNTGVCVYLKASAAFLSSRLENGKASRPLITHLENDKLELFLSDMLEKRSQYYDQARILIDAKDLKISDLKDRLSNLL